jgi:predicted nuclease of predicted toxin-antitoxin system
VKLLFDQNLSHRLVARLTDLFPGSDHVRELGLASADDLTIWTFAKLSGHAIASKDGDFHQLSLLHGAPPKIVWMRVGNSSTDKIEQLMRARAGQSTRLPRAMGH